MESHKGSSSYASSSNQIQRRTWKHDIFLSFRGNDTRRGFTSHLYHELIRTGFRVYTDDALTREEDSTKVFQRTIEESLIAIVILSENYASSSWCLDELQHILVSRNNQGQIVCPIFYYVEPSDVRKQRGRFGEAFAKLEKKFPKDQSKKQKWRDYLTEVANLSGFDTRQYLTEAELIDDVVEHLCKLRSELLPVSVSEALIGIEWRVEEMLKLLEIGLDDVRFIGIRGMGGVGKTTLARALYERFHYQFDFHCFLANIREVSERNGHLHLQNQLLSHLKIKNVQIEDTDQGKSTLGHIFQNRKVMLILDDVNHLSHLENLAGSRGWFGHGSRIIITARDADLLRSHPRDEKIPPGVDEIYEIEPMNHDESLQLFCQKVFRGDPPTVRFLELTESIIIYANGLPLALCVLGSFFSGGRREIEWEDALKMLKKDSNNGIFKVLKLSYDALSHEQKTIFLDIACFFNMWDKDEVTHILESCGLEATTGMKSLIDKSLLVEIELGNIKYIEMHDLTQEMGRLIVSNESPDDLGKRSRLWCSRDINF